MTEDLQEAIEILLQKAAPSDLRKAGEKMSDAYRILQGSQSVFDHESGKLAYLASRMPATFAAAKAVLQQLPVRPSSWLDLGAGPGTASWAAAELFPESQSFTLIEQNIHAIALGKTLAELHPRLQNAHWQKASFPLTLPKADVAIFSYALGELNSPCDSIDRWLQSEIPWLVVIEPGTPRGFACILAIRAQILNKKKYLWAPCPHPKPCPLSGKDWCHFTARLARSRLHRYIKGGEKGYEDEKYSYLIASQTPHKTDAHHRIVRHPRKQSGHVKLSLCTTSGVFQEKIIPKSSPLYRSARKAEWGDIFIEEDMH